MQRTPRIVENEGGREVCRRRVAAENSRGGWVRGVGFRGGGGVVRRDERTPYTGGGRQGEGERRGRAGG